MENINQVMQRYLTLKLERDKLEKQLSLDRDILLENGEIENDQFILKITLTNVTRVKGAKEIEKCQPDLFLELAANDLIAVTEEKRINLKKK